MDIMDYQSSDIETHMIRILISNGFERVSGFVQ